MTEDRPTEAHKHLLTQLDNTLATCTAGAFTAFICRSDGETPLPLHTPTSRLEHHVQLSFEGATHVPSTFYVKITYFGRVLTSFCVADVTSRKSDDDLVVELATTTTSRLTARLERSELSNLALTVEDLHLARILNGFHSTPSR